jgi:serpin B
VRAGWFDPTRPSSQRRPVCNSFASNIRNLAAALRRRLAATPAPGPPPEPIAAGDVVAAANAFALDLYRALGNRPGNLFFSPASISTALAIAYSGARGETQRQMGQTLRFPAPPDQLAPIMGELLRTLRLGDEALPPEPDGPEEYIGALRVIRHRETPPPLLRIANGLWVDRQARILEGFHHAVAEHYEGAFHSLDFRHAPEDARRTINGAVEAATARRIRNLIGPISPDVQLIVTNAVYFRASWSLPFDKGATERSEFRTADDRKVPVSLMRKTRSAAYAETDAFQVIALGYEGQELSMLIVLPRAHDGLEALETGLLPATLTGLSGKLQAGDVRIVDLSLPKFELEDSFELRPTLEALGLTLPFSDEADFSGLTPARVGVSAILHKTFLGLDENGTEAAAATAMVSTPTSLRLGPPPPPPVVFRADHPFLFAIRDDRTGLILFLGRFTEPMP